MLIQRRTLNACVSFRRKPSVLLRWASSLNDSRKLKRQCTDVKSGWVTSVGPSLTPHSLTLVQNSRATVPLNDRSKLKEQCTDVKSGCVTSVGPSLTPHSLSLIQKSRATVPLDQRKSSCVRVHCTRPTEAECCRNERFIRYAYAARFRFIHTRKTLRALSVYTQTVIGVIFVNGNGNTHACVTVLHDDEIRFTSMDAIFKRL